MTTAREILTEDRRYLTVTLDGAEPVPAAYQTRPRLFRPTRLTVAWLSRDGGPWELHNAKLTGPMIKKDGSDSSLFGERGLAVYRGWRDDAPAWARSLAEAHAPAEVAR